MKKQLSLLLISLVLILEGCQQAQIKDPEIGVSVELARQRKMEVKDLQYQLQFHIPENKEEHVLGYVKLSFKQDKVQPIVLDFREEAEKVRQVKVNGQVEIVRLVNEHIVIPERYLKSGANEIEIDFIAGNQSLNRNDEFLYTLLVPERARTLFPCCDQPDLKAVFSLKLDIPQKWVAVANSPVIMEIVANGRKQLVFEPTKPLSTYLFSFVVGKWQQLEETREGKTVSLYYRETDPLKVAQHSIIFDQVFTSLKWLEEYTGMPYPFEKYDLVIVPGFQFGGMEHPGAVLYNDKRMFLGPHPTIEEELGRMELIAHETAHMWFGDAVTMAWFDDVWTKEVFANYFAARMIEPVFPQVNHRLNDLRNFYISAYSEDRTAGSTSIKQSLENLKDAGLIYGQIVYNKAPVMMKMLVKRMGEEAFQKGIQEYLRTYIYGNATWENLISILDKYTMEDLTGWSDSWVNEKGMPEISAIWDNQLLTVRQDDAWKRGMIWPQDLELILFEDQGRSPDKNDIHRLDIKMDSVVGLREISSWVINDPCIFLNSQGDAYGYFVLNPKTIAFALKYWQEIVSPVERLSLLISLNENRLNNRVDPLNFVRSLVENLKIEQEPLIISTAIAYIKDVALHGNMAGSLDIEEELMELSVKPRGKGCQQAAFRALLDIFQKPTITQEIYRIWKNQQPYTGLTLSENDYIKMACELAIRMPEKYGEFRLITMDRIKNPDRLKEFNLIVQSVRPQIEQRDSLFQSLLRAENRQIEPWVTQMIYYLNHPLRQEQAVKYIMPALEELQEIQRTGDIFFPKNWVTALLRGHNSMEATEVVQQFLLQNPDYPMLLKNKILQAADHLYRLQEK